MKNVDLGSILQKIEIGGVELKEKVLDAMKELGKPVSISEVVQSTGLDRKVVDKAFKELKAEGLIVSPVRCKWEPANK